MTCTSCGTENEAARKFCLNCGGRLALACPSCGSANTPGAKFCGECGNALAGADQAAPARTVGPTTERRLVSVLFADLVGFTTLSEARDAEDVRELLGSYFETSRSIVERYGGTVEKFIGDAVMAVWGTPTAQEDDAERAVRAALDLVDAVHRLGAERGVPDLALRAAVHSGEAVVTIGAAGMGMVAGDLVNTASRLQSVAPPGAVLVGEATQRAASNAIAFEPAGDHELKGKESPVPAFRALRVVAQRGGVGRSDQLEPPFVGRESELQLIKDFYHATARERGPRLVSIIGQAGIGKSRLAWEFLKYIDGVTELVYWHQGRSPAYGDGISFWALGEMVRMRIGVGEGSDETSTREHLAKSLDEFVTDRDERRGLEEPLLHLLGIGESRSGDRGQLFVAWRTFFERIAETAPVVMVFEDLQWADEGMLDFIEELVTWSRGRSIYLITLARTELLDRRPTWGAGQRSFTSMSLAPLAGEDVTRLLAGLVPGLSDAVIGQIVQRAEGIPLYAVETVRMLLNDGRIERDGDAFRPVGDLSRLAVPESLHALIAARIDGLAPAERTLVQDASVLGLSFNLAALTAVSRAPAEEIDGMLGHLVQRELLTIDDDARSPERGQYRFVQGLLREVAYGTLSRDDRRARHVAAARYYEALGDEELAAVLAQHYVDAYKAHPDGPEGAAVASQARVALRAAAQRAIGLGSHRLGLSHLEAAIDITREPADELDLQVPAVWASASAGLFDVGVAHAERAIALATELDDAGSRRRMTAALGQLLTEGHLDRSRRVLTEAFEEPGLSPGDPGFLEVAEALAKVEMRTEQHARAIEIADQALVVAEEAGAERLVLELLITRGATLANVNRLTEAVTTLTGALHLARRRGFVEAGHRAAINLSYALATDDPMLAYEVSREGFEVARRSGNEWATRYLLGNASEGAIDVGEWDWARDLANEQLERLTEPEARIWYGETATVIGAYRGEDVDDIARELLEASRAFDDTQYVSVGASGTIAASLASGRLAAVVSICDDVLAAGLPGVEAAPHGARAATWMGDAPTARRMLEAHAIARRGRRTEAVETTMRAGIAALEGRPTAARALYADAQRLWRELGLSFWLAMCDLDIVITGAMEPAERARAAAEAREIFTRLRAQPLLDRLDASPDAARHAPEADGMPEQSLTRPSESASDRI